MPDWKQQFAAAAIAAVVAAGVGATLPAKEKPVHVTVQTSKHAWPDLSDPEKGALAARVTWLSGSKVVIFCDGADCRDLQTDFDDVFEDAKVDSARLTPPIPLGYGIGVVYRADVAQANRLAADIHAASGGRLSPQVRQSSAYAGEGIAIAIGKRPR